MMVRWIKRHGWLAFWLLLTVVLVSLADFESGENSALAEGQQQIEANVKVVPIQLARDRFGLCMVDFVSQNLWIYEVDERAPAHGRLKLVAARSYKYDKMLGNFNTAEPTPEQVKMMLEKSPKITKSDKND